jgi:predicted dehydrogenase
VVELSFGSKPLDEHFPETLVHLEGKEGTVSLGPGYRLGITSPEGREERRVGAVPRAWLSPPAEVIQDSVVHTQAHWVECLRAGRDAETSGADNLRTLELVFGAYASAASGEPYRVKGEAGAPGTVP